MTPSTVLGDIATAISTALGTISGLKVYTYEPRDLDALPAATILGPTHVERTGPLEKELQLGSADWHLGYTVRLYVALDDPATSMAAARSLLGQAIAAIDADRTLGLAYVDDSSLTTAEYGVTDSSEENQRQMAIYECQLQVWALV